MSERVPKPNVTNKQSTYIQYYHNDKEKHQMITLKMLESTFFFAILLRKNTQIINQY